MALPVIYFAGGEDIDFSPFGGQTSITTSSNFRSAFARCGLGVGNNTGINFGVGWQNYSAFTPISVFWLGSRVSVNVSSNTTDFLRITDAAGVPRLRLTSVIGSTDTFQVNKQTAAGVVTQLGSNFTAGLTNAPASPDKLDISVTYAVAGQITVYINGLQKFSFSGDVTTDSTTTLTGLGLGSKLNSNATPLCFWSEIIVSDSDTRAMSLQTLAPVANGNTHNFDIGTPAAANVNEITLNDATLDGSDTAGEIDQYTIPALAAGTYSILAIAISARMLKGASGPTKMDTGVRSGGADNWNADQVLTTSWAAYRDIMATDPATSAAWAALPANIGLRSVT